ncbi:glucosaminidase domain-containing protein [Paramuribaculum intestinale]|uniref:glucosaminidase domain-containing protein n=1 Tax=Paramuribaculum intestinale TaxID=2094151 RepID=UPI0025A96CD4|nr:glucosaminidase domain-containing protein [Paramuribaculum intestinale]
MKWTRLIALFVVATMLAGSGVYAEPRRKKPRIAKPLRKIHTDTIAIPDDIVFDSFDTPAEESAESPSFAVTFFSGDEAIMGPTQIDPETMWLFVSQRNPDFPIEIAQAFYDVGQIYGIRGDVALCQSILETGWFLYTGGTAVRPEQHNYCGLGVTRKGIRGHAFKDPREGVTAQIQHLYAYASTGRLPKGEGLVDPRFSLVSRGVASTWHDLNGRWAANDHYGTQIMKLYADLCAFSASRQ